MEKDDKELIKRLTKRIEYIEKLEHIEHPTILKELIMDLTDRIDELDGKLYDLKNNRF